jgi:hypothetical protein
LLFAASPAAPAASLGIGAPQSDGGKDGGGEDVISFQGIINSRPNEKVGTWVISSTTYMTYTATNDTELEEQHGGLSIGACVEVKSLASAPTVAIKIESQEANECVGDDNGGDDNGDDHGNDDGEHHDGDHHGDDDDLVHYGHLESRPDGITGTWVIEGVSYTATANTELDVEHGALVAGVCVKVEVSADAPTVAKEIQSESEYRCSGSDDDGHNAKGTLFGVIEKLPADLHNGIWEIGGLSFVVSPTTELVSKGGTFTVGLTVKVDFITDISDTNKVSDTDNVSDTNFARRIEIKFGPSNVCHANAHNEHGKGPLHGGDDKHHGNDNHHGADDLHKYGYCPGEEGKSIGIIDSRPQGTLIGDWMIGGIPYSTTVSTKFASGDDFLAGERVKVEYVIISDTVRVVTEMEETDDNGGVDHPNSSLIVGYVDAKPAAFVGDWTINGAPFVAISTTVFIEHGSLLAVGSYVVVQYDIVNDMRVIRKILTYVPPGAGDDDKVGHLEVMGGVVAAGVDGSLQNSETWTVDGVDYVVSEATQLVDSGGELVAGAVVYVNSYSADGQRFATLIRTQGSMVYIPMAER